MNLFCEITDINFQNPLSAGCGVYTTWKHVSATLSKSETTSGWNWKVI